MSKMYYAENPDAAHDIHELRVDLLGEKMTFLTDAGVFSKKMVDFGSQLLLKTPASVKMVMFSPHNSTLNS